MDVSWDMPHLQSLEQLWDPSQRGSKLMGYPFPSSNISPMFGKPVARSAKWIRETYANWTGGRIPLLWQMPVTVSNHGSGQIFQTSNQFDDVG